MATICFHHVTASMEGLRKAGGDDRAILAGLDLNPAILDGPGQRIHSDLVARLFKQVQLELNDEFMGFTRNNCKVGIFSLMCQFVSTSSNLGELLERSCNFYNLVTDDVQMALSVQKDRSGASNSIYKIKFNEPSLDPEHFLAEFLLIIWHRFASWFIGEPITLMETHFAFSPPRHHDELAIMFPSKRRFNCKANRLVFDAAYLNKPLARSNQELEQFMKNAPADVMTIPGYDSTLEAQIERIILNNNPGSLQFPGIHKLSAQLGISTQTLHRHLKKSGSSYQRIKDNLRRSTAIKKLADKNLSIDDVSDSVGFAESRSFTRAFRQWTGMSPRAYRKSLQ